MQSMTREQLFNRFEEMLEEELSVPDITEDLEDHDFGSLVEESLTAESFETIEDHDFDEMEVI